jgi:hypothetical protein
LILKMIIELVILLIWKLDGGFLNKFPKNGRENIRIMA